MLRIEWHSLQAPQIVCLVCHHSLAHQPCSLFIMHVHDRPRMYMEVKVVDSILYSQKYLAEIKFGGWAPNRQFKNIGKFKFGGLVRDRRAYEILVDFNLAVTKIDRQTAKFSSYTVCPNYYVNTDVWCKGEGRYVRYRAL